MPLIRNRALAASLQGPGTPAVSASRKPLRFLASSTVLYSIRVVPVGGAFRAKCSAVIHEPESGTACRFLLGGVRLMLGNRDRHTRPAPSLPKGI